jgi:hypothetical protein
MLVSSLFRPRYLHISLLRKYNFKSHYRYTEPDRYIAAYNFDKIKNYIDFSTKDYEVRNIQLHFSEE